MPDEILPATSDVHPSNVTEITQAEDGLASVNSSKSEPIPDVKTTTSTNKDKIISLRKLIQKDLDYINDASLRLKDYESRIANRAKDASDTLKSLEALFLDQEDGSPEELMKFLQHSFNQLHKSVMKLKTQIPSEIKSQSQDSHAYQMPQSRDYTNSQESLHMPKLYKNAIFEDSESFKSIEELYNGLDIRSKNCLLCFAVFPENATIKKRVMIYWWIGEGFVPAGSEAGKVGTEIFTDLIVKRFIEPVSVNRGLEVNSCKLNPLVRTAVVMLAERARFFDFDNNGNAEEAYSHSLRACLAGQGLVDIQKLDRLHMLFNVNETILEFKPEWFAQMKNANILYFGRWQSTGKHHIEVEDPTFLEGLKFMKYLKFLSLQGISRITELPDSISKLKALIILDIRACHNLEVIPSGIGLLKNLTHLDMTECYLLDRMPKDLSLLTNLVVLKGFVVDESNDKNSCNVEDLVKLQTLKKLTIYTSSKNFPTERDLYAFVQLESLLKLTIEWGGASLRKQVTASPGNTDGEAATSKEDNKAQQRKGGKDSSETSPQRAKNAPGESDASGEEAKDKGESMVTKTEKEGSRRVGEQQDEDKRVVVAAATKQDDEVKTTRDAKAAKQDSKWAKKETRGIAAETPEGAAATKLATASLARSKTLLPKKKRPTSDSASLPGLPPNLEKLDLKCFPIPYTPDWLKPGRFQKLKRLYIRGGKLRDLGQASEWDIAESGMVEQDKWNVEILRLKYLAEMKMNWKELKQLFPNLTYLEKVKCPQLTLFPCDGHGVWMNKSNPEKQQSTNMSV